jgi:hypothetical protein
MTHRGTDGYEPPKLIDLGSLGDQTLGTGRILQDACTPAVPNATALNDPCPKPSPQ